MNKKYTLLENDTVEVGDRTLYRIKSLKDFSNVTKGDLGGYIEKESNLNHDGDVWVYRNAKVYDNAHVSGDAYVYDNAEVFGTARMYDTARVSGYVKVYGDAKVSGDAWVSDNAQVSDNAEVFGTARVYGDAHVNGTTILSNNDYGILNIKYKVSPKFIIPNFDKIKKLLVVKGIDYNTHEIFIENEEELKHFKQIENIKG